MAYLRCPECRLTARAAAYYLRGDQCPRCLTAMVRADTFRDAPERAVVAVAAEASAGAAARTAGSVSQPA